MGDRQYTPQGDFSQHPGAHHPVQVQYVQQQPYQQPPPQQEQVVYQTLQTPQQQQQQQPPQYTTLVIQPNQHQHQQQQQQQQPVVMQQQQYQYQQQQPQPVVIQHSNQQPHYQQRPVMQPQQQYHGQTQYIQVHQHPQQQQQQHPQPVHPHQQVIRLNKGQVQQIMQANGQPRFIIRAADNFGRKPGQQIVLRVQGQQGFRPQQQQQQPVQQQQPMQQQQHHRPHILQTAQMRPQTATQVRMVHQGPRLTMIRPGQQIRFVQQQPQQPPQPRPRMQFQPQPRPPQQPPQPPPMPSAQQPQSEIAYNVEHVFTENGKTVRKMPILMGDQTIWVDCVTSVAAEDSQNSMLLDLDLNPTTSTTASEQPQATAAALQPPQRAHPTNKSAKDFTEEERKVIIDKVTEELISPAELAKLYNVNVAAIRGWVKASGKKLPQKYNVTSTGTNVKAATATTPKPTEAQPNNNQSLLIANQPVVNQEETITVYPAPESEHANALPQQVVRQMVVTDNKMPGQALPNQQLQLPQRPMPPNMPKPMPAKGPEPHKPKIIPGKVAVCRNCGGFSVDISKCMGCKKIIPEGAKIMPDPDYKPIETEKKLIVTTASNSDRPGDLRNIRIQPKARRKPTANEEPECIALSSDEEDNADDDSNMDAGADSSNVEKSEDQTAAAPNAGDANAAKDGNSGGDDEKDSEGQGNSTEKTDKSGEFKLGSGSVGDGRLTGVINELQSLIKGEANGQFASLTCRSIRVGSYKTLTKEKVYFTQKAIILKVPYMTNPKNNVTVVIPASDILKIEMLAGRSMPILFISTAPTTCDRVRKDLNITFKSQGLYFDLASPDETMKRITMLPEKMPDDVKNLLNQFYGNTISELDSKSANDLLVKSTPKTATMQQQQALQQMQNKKAEISIAAGSRIEKYCQFPPTGANSISVTQEDYFCLEDETFLNDVIIDFYLKWIQHTLIPPESREKTHVFSTFFYKRLTTRPPKMRNKLHPIEDNVNLTAADKRYDRVKRWTKNVNIFDKDYVIVPINEHSHWFVAVICFPGLTGKQRMDNGQPVEEDVNVEKSVPKTPQQEPKRKIMQIGSTSIIPLKSGSSSFSIDDDSDRDEAEADDDDMVVEEDSSSSVVIRANKPLEIIRTGKPSDESKSEDQKDIEKGDEKPKDEEKALNGTEASVNEDKAKNEAPKEGAEEKAGEASEEKKDADEKSKDGTAEEEAKSPSEKIAIKQPCILIFDSLQTGSRCRVAATLREYLKCEYKARLKEERDFNRDNIQGCVPKVPQQPNFSDCGLFVLQYVESFFKAPITDFSLPIKSLRGWFPSEVMRKKRAEIATIIRDLSAQQLKDKKINFPNLVFTPESGSGYTDDEDESTNGKPLLKSKFLVKTASGPMTPTTTRVICLSSTKSLTLTPTKAATPSSVTTSNNPALMIQRKKGKIECFSLQQGNKAKVATTPTIKAIGTPAKKVNVLIPRLTAGPGDKVIRKEITVASVSSTTSYEDAKPDSESNGPEKEQEEPSQSPDSTSKTMTGGLVSYSDSSPEDADPLGAKAEDDAEATLDMDVDEDGAPIPLSLPAPVPSIKRPNSACGDSEAAKKAKVEEENEEKNA